MKRHTQLVTLLGLGGALLIGSAVHAQGYPGGTSTSGGGYPGGSYPGGSSSSSGSSGGATGAGAINSSSLNTAETTTTDTTNTTGTSTPPNTGGEPLLMSLLGSLTASSALLLRRKVR